MSPNTLLCLLITGASITGAFLYGHAQQGSSIKAGIDVAMINKIQSLQEEITQLRQESITLRELAESNSDFILPREWIHFVEEACGFSFQTTPTVIRGMEDEFLKSASSAWTSHFSEAGMIDRQYALSVVGLIPEGNLTIQLALAETGPGIRRALYDYDRGIILTAFDFDDKNIFDQTSLTQALAVALLEQQFPIESKLSDDAWIARRMVVHGNSKIIQQLHLTKLQQRFQLNGAEIKSPVSQEAIRNALLDFQELPLYVRETIKSHALWGRSFVESQDGETRAEQIAYALAKATTSLSVIAGKNIPAPKLQENGELILHTTLGAMAVYLHASNGETISNPLELVKSWVSDELQFHQDEQGQLVVRWNITFSSKQASLDFSAHLRDLDASLEVTEQDGVVKLLSRKPLL